MSDVLLIEPCDFVSFPVGGQLSFAKQMMTAFGNCLALVGISTDGTQVGRWVEKRFDGKVYRFLAVGQRTPSGRRPLVPARATAYLDIRRHKKQILSAGVRHVFTQSPETIMAIHTWPWESICYRFAGYGNPLQMARYRWARYFAGVFDAKLYTALKKTDVILASADKQAICSLADRSKGLLPCQRIIQFPTRVDTNLFRPLPKLDVRRELGLDGSGPYVVSCGRINEFKGWDFLIKAFELFRRAHNEARLLFVGDGEDRPLLEQTLKKDHLADSVLITGFENRARVAQYLNAADVFVVGSRIEGWSVAMLEGLACGKPIVSTDISGARDMIVEGKNGFIVTCPDPQRFADAIQRALGIEEPNALSLRIAESYSLANLKRDLGQLWKPLAETLREPGCETSVMQNEVAAAHMHGKSRCMKWRL